MDLKQNPVKLKEDIDRMQRELEKKMELLKKINKKEEKKEYVKKKCQEHNKDIGITSNTSAKKGKERGAASKKVSFHIQEVGPGGNTNSQSGKVKVTNNNKSRTTGSKSEQAVAPKCKRQGSSRKQRSVSAEESTSADGSEGASPAKKQKLDVAAERTGTEAEKNMFTSPCGLIQDGQGQGQNDPQHMSQSESEDPHIIPSSQQVNTKNKRKSQRRMSLPVFRAVETVHSSPNLNKTFTTSAASPPFELQDIDISMHDKSTGIEDRKSEVVETQDSDGYEIKFSNGENETGKTRAVGNDTACAAPGVKRVLAEQDKIEVSNGEDETGKSTSVGNDTVACAALNVKQVLAEEDSQGGQHAAAASKSQIYDLTQNESSGSQDLPAPRKRGRRKKSGTVDSLDYSFLDDDVHDMYSQIKNRRRSRSKSVSVYLDARYSIDTSLLQYSEELISQNVSFNSSPTDDVSEHPQEEARKVPPGGAEGELSNSQSNSEPLPLSSPEKDIPPGVPVVPKLQVDENILHFSLPDSQFAHLKLDKSCDNLDNSELIPSSRERANTASSVKKGRKSKKKTKKDSVLPSKLGESTERSSEEINGKAKASVSDETTSNKPEAEVVAEKSTKRKGRGRQRKSYLDKDVKAAQKPEGENNKRKRRKSDSDKVSTINSEEHVLPNQNDNELPSKGKRNRDVGVKGKKRGRPKKQILARTDSSTEPHESNGINNIKIQEDKGVQPAKKLSVSDSETVHTNSAENDTRETSRSLCEEVECDDSGSVTVQSKRKRRTGKPRHGRGQGSMVGTLNLPDGKNVKESTGSDGNNSDNKTKHANNHGNEIAVMVNVASDADLDHLSSPVSQTLADDWYQGGSVGSTEGHYSDAVQDQKKKSGADNELESELNHETTQDANLISLDDNATSLDQTFVLGETDQIYKAKLTETDSNKCQKTGDCTVLTNTAVKSHIDCVVAQIQTKVSEKNKLPDAKTRSRGQNEKAVSEHTKEIAERKNYPESELKEGDVADSENNARLCEVERKSEKDTGIGKGLVQAEDADSKMLGEQGTDKVRIETGIVESVGDNNTESDKTYCDVDDGRQMTLFDRQREVQARGGVGDEKIAEKQTQNDGDLHQQVVHEVNDGNRTKAPAGNILQEVDPTDTGSEDEFAFLETVDDGVGQITESDVEEEEMAPPASDVEKGEPPGVGEGVPPDTESEEDFALEQTPEIKDFLQHETEDEEEFALPEDKAMTSTDSDSDELMENVVHSDTEHRKLQTDLVPDTAEDVSSAHSDTDGDDDNEILHVESERKVQVTEQNGDGITADKETARDYVSCVKLMTPQENEGSKIDANQSYGAEDVASTPAVTAEETSSSDEDNKCRLRTVNVEGNYYDYNNAPIEITDDADDHEVAPLVTAKEEVGETGENNGTDGNGNVQNQTDLKIEQNEPEVKDVNAQESDEKTIWKLEDGPVIDLHMRDVTPQPEDRTSLEEYQMAQEDSDENLMDDQSEEDDLDLEPNRINDLDNKCDLDAAIDDDPENGVELNKSGDLDKSGEFDLDKSKESAISGSSSAEGSEDQPVSTSHGFIQLQQRIEVDSPDGSMIQCVVAGSGRTSGHVMDYLVVCMEGGQIQLWCSKSKGLPFELQHTWDNFQDTMIVSVNTLQCKDHTGFVLLSRDDTYWKVYIYVYHSQRGRRFKISETERSVYKQPVLCVLSDREICLAHPRVTSSSHQVKDERSRCTKVTKYMLARDMCSCMSDLPLHGVMDTVTSLLRVDSERSALLATSYNTMYIWNHDNGSLLMHVTLTTALTLESDLHSAALLTACHAVRVIRGLVYLTVTKSYSGTDQVCVLAVNPNTAKCLTVNTMAQPCGSNTVDKVCEVHVYGALVCALTKHALLLWDSSRGHLVASRQTKPSSTVCLSSSGRFFLAAATGVSVYGLDAEKDE